MAAKRFWAELKTSEFAGLNRDSTLAILPVAATEQHGPHLPVMTDTAIGEGLIKTVLERLPDDLDVLILPTQTIGKSDEHLRSPGTITHAADNLVRSWCEIGEGVHRAGLRKMVIANSHGGNIEVIGIVARELRVRLEMLVVTTQWRRFGLPAGLYSPFELSHGIHAGDIETSLMLYFRPDLVDMSKAERFSSKAAEMEEGYKYLRPVGQHAFGWIAQDINPDGAVGEASSATAEKGRLTAEHQADGFIALLRDVARFPLRNLA
ncbi:MAG TPA: creatininase family protein [Xanthobacteraceae bacterium]|jgi:creatinine amidohydrolase|nr:creatininase family protein [Xanthobacteraceae bacterium]